MDMERTRKGPGRTGPTADQPSHRRWEWPQGRQVLPAVLVERSDFPGSERKLLVSEAVAGQVPAHRTALTVYGEREKSWLTNTSWVFNGSSWWHPSLLRHVSQLSEEWRNKFKLFGLPASFSSAGGTALMEGTFFTSLFYSLTWKLSVLAKLKLCKG